MTELVGWVNPEEPGAIVEDGKPRRRVKKYNPADGAMRVHAAEAAEKAAKRTRDIEAIERAVRIRLESQRDFAVDYQGRFPSVRETGGPGRGKTSDMSVAGLTAEDWCQQHGFHIRTVQRWCERLLEPVKFESEFHSIMQKVLRLVQLEQAANFMSESVEWYTPAKYLEGVRELLGEIDLDPASNDTANRIVRAKRYFSANDDGLALDWFGRVFVNPPYGKSEEHGSLAGAFCNKAMAEYESGNVQACVILVNSLHSQNWQAALYEYAVCFVDHRIQFISGDGEENKNPTFQNILVYLGPERTRFAQVFSRFGYCMAKIDV